VIPRVSIFLAVAVICATPVAPQTQTSSDGNPLVRMWDSWTTLHPTAGPNNIENCVVVHPDGQFHLELRRQEFLDGRAALHIYEGTLDAGSVQTLKNLLDADAIKKLATPKLPRFPLSDDAPLEGFSAAISRTDRTQDVGYFVVKARGPDNPDTVVQEWQESQMALQPLVEWFRALKTFKTPAKHRVSNSRSTVCGLAQRVEQHQR
jgi:hypothetical protein